MLHSSFDEESYSHHGYISQKQTHQNKEVFSTREHGRTKAKAMLNLYNQLCKGILLLLLN